MGRDIWCGARHYDSDEAESAAQDSFEADLAAIWADATPAQRRAISHERWARGIRSKARRDLTATEWAVLDGLSRAAWLAAQRAEPGPDEVPF
jgi:hypothetical protein